MSLWNIALKNTKKNFSNYFLYFISMVFSIMIYYMFISIKYNPTLAAQLKGKISAPFDASAVVLIIFVGIFIWYSNSFFTKKRKKEIALYSLLGVKKKEIGSMLFYETICMGIVALLVGIGVGALLSKLFSSALLKVMGFENFTVAFTLSKDAVLQTSVVFLVLFLVASIHSYSIIYRFKLVDLFKADASSESEPKVSSIKSLLAVIFIGLGYLSAYKIELNPLINPLLAVAFCSIGSFFLFSSFVIFLIKKSRKNTHSYYKGLNMIGTSNLLYRIKSNSRTLATIAVLSATTLTAMGFVFSMYYSSETSSLKSAPYSFAYKIVDDKIDKNVHNIIDKYKNNSISYETSGDFIALPGKIPNVIKQDVAKTSGNKMEESQDAFFYVISQDIYNNFAKGIKKDTLTLSSDNDTILLDAFYMPKLQNSYKDKKVTLNNNSELTIKDFKDYPIVNMNLGTFYTLVVSNNTYDSLKTQGEIVKISAINVENKNRAKEVTEDINKSVFANYKEMKSPVGSEYYTYYSSSLEMSGLLIFIGSFLGLVFLICTASIIFFKEISEATSDKINYDILKKVGASKKDIRFSIAKQIFFVFLSPLVVGLCHASMAIYVLAKLLSLTLLKPAIICFGAYTLIYLVFYILTVNSYYKAATAEL